MKRQDYQAFSDALQHNLENDPRVLGLIAAGSMAGLSHQPDEWSDHDFWLVVQADAVEWFVHHPEWLPDYEHIAFMFQESHGGMKVVYQNAHLLEFAITDRERLRHFKVNDYRLMIDKVDLASQLNDLYTSTSEEASHIVKNEIGLMGQFLTNLLVGVGRYRRGEKFSARLLITTSSLYALLRLIPIYFPAEQPELLDNLDPLRRFEQVYPEFGEEINTILSKDLESAAGDLLRWMDALLRDKMANYPTEAVEAIQAFI